MVSQIVLGIAFCILICKDIGLVESADECKTHADCKNRHCCRNNYWGHERRCTILSSCLYQYCSTESDCGDSSLCCRSNKCEGDGCHGCTKDSDCYSFNRCCKKTFPFNQTVCRASCVNELCNSNDDCAGWNVCCRYGKCVNSGCYSKCTLNSDCNLGKYCCRKKKSWYSLYTGCSKSCVGESCSSDDDCGGPNECCISNKCVNRGCSGCYNNSDCYSGQYCCKKTFSFDQRFCSAKCINVSCNSNNDCGGWGECCRSGKCVSKGCNDKCTSNSECHLGQYCCKKKKQQYWGGDSCGKSCVGEICSSDDDCGGPNECCISNKCVIDGCSGCNTTSDCSNEHYCCKKKEWYELSECSVDCIGKSCGTNDDCGGPGETCDSDNRCANSFPSWAIAVIVVSLVVFFIAVGIFLALYWYFRKIRPANATPANTRRMAPLDTRGQEAVYRNPQPNTQISGFTIPMAQHQMTGLQNQPAPYDSDVAHSTQNPSFSPQQFPNTVQNANSQDRVDNSPPPYTPQQDNENHGFYNLPGNLQHPGNPTSTRNATEQDNEVPQFYNQLHNPIHHTFESPDVAQFQGVQQTYPENTLHQDHHDHRNPPYNPHYQGKH